MIAETVIQDHLASLRSFRPELVLASGSVALLVLDLVLRRARWRRQALTFAAMTVVGLTAGFLVLQPVSGLSLLGRLFVSDGLATFFKWISLLAGLPTVVLAGLGDDVPARRLGRFYALLTSTILGLFLMASATDLLSIYLSVELVSLPCYLMTGFRDDDRKASEAALKHVLSGALSSATMLFGMSYLYGLLGTTDILEFAPRIGLLATDTGAVTAAHEVTLVVAVLLVSSGVGYKIASAPWHMWCPDVYEGAPTPFTAFLSIGPKAAGFALASRFFCCALAGPLGEGGVTVPVAGLPWPALVGVLSAVTMTLGNLTALAQTNLKRLLAYSSIAHTGYLLMGLSALSVAGLQAVMVHTLVYAIVNLGAFVTVTAIHQTTGSETIFDCRGLVRRHPLSAVTFAVFLLALIGLPPSAGFTGKWYLFCAVIERAMATGGSWYGVLALIAALNTAVSSYFYARVVRVMFLSAPYTQSPLRPKAAYSVMLVALCAATLLFGIWWAPLADWSRLSIQLLRG